MHITYFKYQITTQSAAEMLNTKAICYIYVRIRSMFIYTYIATRVSSNISSKLNLNPCVRCSGRRWTKILERLVIRAVLQCGRKRALQHQHPSPLPPSRQPGVVGYQLPVVETTELWQQQYQREQEWGHGLFIHQSDIHAVSHQNVKLAGKRLDCPAGTITQSTRHLLCWLI